MRFRISWGILVLGLILGGGGSASGQSSTVIKAVDPSAGTTTNVGDTANHALRVNIIAGAGSGGTAMTDNSAMTLGTTAFTLGGGTFQTTVTSLSSGVAAAFRITAQRGLHSNLRDAAGNELATTARPLWTQLGDGTNGPAAVKAASTAAVAADPALVMRSVQLPTALAASGGLKVDGSAVAQPVQGINFDGITGATPLSPVTVGGHYLASQPVYSDDAVTSFASTQRGALVVAPGVEGFPISAAALPLPTGASTSALQTTGNTSIASIDTKTPALGQALAAASTPVVLTAAQIATLTPLSTVTATQGNAGTNAQAWWMRLGDATNGPVAVKAASTVAALTDPALVIRPLTYSTGAITTTGTPTSYFVNVGNVGAATMSLTVSGTLTGLSFFIAGGSNGQYSYVPFYSISASGGYALVAPATNVTGGGPYLVPLQGFDTVQIVAAQSSAGAIILLAATPGSMNPTVNLRDTAGAEIGVSANPLFEKAQGLAASGAAKSGNPLQFGSVFNTTQPTVTTGQMVEAQATARGAQIIAKGVDGFTIDNTTFTATQVTAANLNATVTQLALTKGTQGATGVSTQDLHDAGRTAISFYANNFATGATTVEKIITWDQSKGTGAITSATASYTITNGKTLRITGLQVASRGNATATIQTTTFNLRLNTGGACIVSSTPILFAAQSATAAVASAWDRVIIPIPDGYEIAGNGTIAICITAAATFVTNAPTWAVNLIGYEY